MAADTRSMNNSGNTAPCQDAETAVQSDTLNLATLASGGVPSKAYCYRALYVSGAGDVKVVTIGGSTVVFAAVPAGTILPVACVRVFSTGTTATGLVGMW